MNFTFFNYFPNCFNRVGDKTFVNWVESNGGLTAYYRCTHIEDPVPHLPMEILGFEHGEPTLLLL